MRPHVFLPFILFLLIVMLLWRGLSLHPNEIHSPLIDKTAPVFQLPELLNPEKTVTNQDFYGHITLLNVWATWCYACAHEHAFLLELAKNQQVILLGLNYKDDPSKAKKWLSDYGNPYQNIAVDRTGYAAIDWGVYGTPETFILDKKGAIRYRKIGPLTAENWQREIKPVIDQLQKERS